MDLEMYKLYRRLRLEYNEVKIVITEQDILLQPKANEGPLAYRNYIAKRFLAEHNIVVARFQHDYNNKKLGLVYQRGDSDIFLTYEVSALVGYNSFECRDKTKLQEELKNFVLP